MKRTFHVALGSSALVCGAVVGLPGIALADTAVCKLPQVPAGYSGQCVTPPVTPILGGGAAPGQGVTPPSEGAGGGTVTQPVKGEAAGTVTGRSPASLPFTGDEVLVLSIAGTAALAAGAALVVAGRRKSPRV